MTNNTISAIGKRIYIIDVGAGLVDSYRALLGQHTGLHIASFEPHPEVYSEIVKKKEQWCVNSPCIQARLMVYQQAISVHEGDSPFYMLNNRTSSSIYPLNGEGASRWRYPFGRPRFRVQKRIDVPCTTISKHINDNRIETSTNTVDLLFIDVQGCAMQVLCGIDKKTYRLIKRIVVKVIIAPFELYDEQSHVVDVLDTIRSNNFKLLRSTEYSNKQERYLEFANLQYFKQSDTVQPSHWFNIDSTGQFRIDID